MAGKTITFHPNDKVIQKILNETTVPNAVAKAAGKVRDLAKMDLTRTNRIDTGRLRNSIISQRVSAPAGQVRYEVGSPLPYAIYQHEGVKGPVYPRRAKVLRFKPKGSNHFVFAQHTKGFMGVPYLTRSLARLTVNDFT